MIIAGAMAAGLIATPVTMSAATAASSYSGAVYQITWSLNCDHASAPCATDPSIGLGGFWGWVALMPASSGYTDNGQETVCSHGGNNGAFHQSFDSTWFMFHSATPVGPVTDPHGNYLVVNDKFGLFPIPATPGHYAVSFEGATGQVQVSP